MRYGHKLWVDLNTGMLLMTRTYDDKHEVVEQFAFSQLQIGGNINPEKVKPRFSTGGGATGAWRTPPRCRRTWAKRDGRYGYSRPAFASLLN
jgi:sigma-E factor negative regulatory protein RseB